MHPPTRSLRVLLVEDNPGDARLLRMALEDAGGSFEVEQVDRLGEALVRLEEGRFDVVLLDLSLPDSHGLDTLRSLRSEAGDTAVVVLTGLTDEAPSLEAVQQGAQDYLVKGTADGEAVARSIRYAVERQRILGELETLRREQLRMKEDLLSQISHDLRNPLMSVIGFAELLLEESSGEVTEEQRELLELILAGGRQLQAMVDDLMEAARAVSAKLSVVPAEVPLRPFLLELRASLAMAAAEKDQVLSVEIEDPAPVALADPLRLQQILGNLVSNAVKFTPAGGSITVDARRDPIESGSVRISVVDTGPGMHAEEAARVFDRSYQAGGVAQRDGLGLGLFISKSLTERLGGRIWVETSPGAGSTFSFTLPCVPATAEPGGILRIRLRGGEVSRSILEEVAGIVERCSYPEDVLLPWSSDEPGRLLVAIRGDEEAVVVAAKRLRRQLGISWALRERDIRFEVDVVSREAELGRRLGVA